MDKVIGALEAGRINDVRQLGSEPCEFTDWYEGDGTARYGRLDEFRALGVAHAALRGLLDEALRPRGDSRDASDADLMASRLRKGLRAFVDQLNAFETNLARHDRAPSTAKGKGCEVT